MPSGRDDADLDSMLEKDMGLFSAFAAACVLPVTGGCVLVPEADGLRSSLVAEFLMASDDDDAAFEVEVELRFPPPKADARYGWFLSSVGEGGNGLTASQSMSTSVTSPFSSAVSGTAPAVALRCLGPKLDVDGLLPPPSSPESSSNGILPAPPPTAPSSGSRSV